MSTRPISDAGMAKAGVRTEGARTSAFREPTCGASSLAGIQPVAPPPNPAARSEAELLERLLRQETLAQRELVSYYLPVLSGFVEHRFRLTAADAEDVAIDVLASFLATPGRFEAGRGVRLRTWLIRVAANRAIDLLRKRALAAEVELASDVACPDAVPLAVGAGLSVARIVEEVCEAMPPEQRQILWWYAYKVPHGTIAAWVGKSDAAVRQTVVRLKRIVAERVLMRVSEMPAYERHRFESRVAALLPELTRTVSGRSTEA